MEFWLVVEAIAAIGADAVRNRPTHNVAEGVVVEVQVERDGIIEADIFVADRIAMQQAQIERDHAPVLTPDEKPRAIRHAAADLAEKFLRKFFEPKLRSVVHL